MVLGCPAEEEDGDGEEEGADYYQGHAVFWETDAVVCFAEFDVDAVEGKVADYDSNTRSDAFSMLVF